MKPKLYIGFGSRAYVGKDTAFKALLDAGLPVQRIGFADTLKKDLAPLLAMVGVDVYTTDPKIKEIIRPLLICYAETLKKFDPSFFIRRAFETELDEPIVVFTDVRYHLESDLLKEVGGILINIEADVPYVNEIETLYSPQINTRADYRIFNDMTPKFKTDVVNLVTSIAKNRGVF